MFKRYLFCHPTPAVFSAVLVFFLWLPVFLHAEGPAPVVVHVALHTSGAPEEVSAFKAAFGEALESIAQESQGSPIIFREENPTTWRGPETLDVYPSLNSASLSYISVSYGDLKIATSIPSPSSRSISLFLQRILERIFSVPGDEGRASRSPVRFIDSFSLANERSFDLPAGTSTVFDIASGANGNLFVSAFSTVLEISPSLQPVSVPTKELNDGSIFSGMGSLAVTTEGSLFVQSVFGTSVWDLHLGSPGYRTIDVDGTGPKPMAVLPDGSLVLISPQQRQARILEGGNSRLVPLPDTASIAGVHAGPEGTFWISDNMFPNALLLYGIDGSLKDLVLLDLPVDQRIGKWLYLDEGRFLVATQAGLSLFSRKGRLLWIYGGSRDNLGMNFATASLAKNRASPFLFLSDTMSGRVYRFWDSDEPMPDDLKTVSALQAKLRANPGDNAPYSELADIYAASGAVDMASACLDSYVASFPEDRAAKERRLRVQVEFLKQKAARSKTLTERQLREFGPETARNGYTLTMKTYETLQTMVPDDNDVRSQKADLRQKFQNSENLDASPVKPVPQIVSVDLNGLFPSLMQVYLKKSPGTITVRNTLQEPLTAIRADFFVARYMDFTAQGEELSSLAPGASATLPLPVQLNQLALDVQEDVPLQAQITLNYTTSLGPQTMVLTRQAVLYRKTAITWDVTSKLGAFVTPNEGTVDILAHDLVKSKPDSGPFSPVFLRALTICSGLGAIPLKYVPDPNTPISATLGNSLVVDTVRFPRTTLLYEGGDCSDTTALTTSLFEAVAIPTAFITTPGHIFMAFDTGERWENVWMFQAPGFEVLKSGGTVWIPLETTVLAKGFAEAWRTASGLVRSYRDTKDFEFIPLKSARALFPSLPLAPSSQPPVSPNSLRLKALESNALDTLDSDLYGKVLDRLTREAGGASGKEASRQANRIAVFMSRYGRFDDAAAQYGKLTHDDPGYEPAYINWVNLDIQTGNFTHAAEILKQAQGRFPRSEAVAHVASLLQKQGRGEGSSGVRAAGEADLNWVVE